MRAIVTLIAVLSGVAAPSAAMAQQSDQTRTGSAAFGDWRTDAPGVKRLITPRDVPPAYDTSSSSNGVRNVARADRKPTVPAGFEATLVADGLDKPRLLRVAPNGDVFVAESSAGRIRVLRGVDGGAPTSEVFASGLNRPFGIAFYPPGDQPEWVYVANTDSIVRFPYRSGDTKAGSRAETVVPKLPTGGHWTRDVVFSADGKRMFVAVGSNSNVGDGMGKLAASALDRWRTEQPLGAAWGNETNRAAVLAFDPNGRPAGMFASGIRNCVSMAIEPGNGALWCATNERDGLGDDVPPDYLTRVREGGFYGWPWYYIGGNEDPRHKAARPDLKDKMTIPDVLVQSHSAPLGMTFYDGTQFPAEYRGSAFAALHGSWNRAKRTGYKVVRTVMTKDGEPTGAYEDFATGFAVDDTSVWGRPVGVAIAKDGALLISEDAGGTIWRVAYRGRAAQK